MTFRPPAGAWSRRGTLLVLLVVLGPVVAALALRHDGQVVDLLAVARAVVVGSGALATAALLAVHARLAGNDHSVVLSTCLGVFAVVTLAGAGTQLRVPDAVDEQRASALGVSTLLVLGLLVLVTSTRRTGSALPLVLAGAGLGAAALVVQHVALTTAPVIDTATVPILGVLLCAVTVAFADEFRWLDALPHWLRARSAIGMLSTASSAVICALPGPAVVRVVATLAALGLALLGAVLLATAAAALLRELVNDAQRQLTHLQRRLTAVERDRRADGARLHDINSLVAGVTSAFRLINDLPPSNHRDGLQVMVLAELERLQRLLADRRAAGQRHARWLRVEEVLTRIAVSHRSRGRVVSLPVADIGDLRVTGDADDLAQLLDILVDNAAQHGSPDDIHIGVHRTAGAVEISVTDAGAGVPPDLRDAVFQWGLRGPGSNGSGIGLSTARALAARLGGELRLEPTGPGARFVLAVPVPERFRSPAEELALARP